MAWPRASKSLTPFHVALRHARPRLVAQGPGDLARELVVKIVDQIADVIHHVPQVQAVAPTISGIQNLLERFSQGDNRLVIGSEQ